jgi:hypothetical protein
LRRAFPQDAADLASCRIVCVQYAPCAVSSFHRQLGLAIGGTIELHTPRHQLADEPWAVFYEHLDGLRIAQAVTGGDGVRRMQFGSVAGPNGRRDTTLCMAGVAFAGTAFGEDEDVAVTGDFGSRAERGDAAADDEKV